MFLILGWWFQLHEHQIKVYAVVCPFAWVFLDMDAIVSI